MNGHGMNHVRIAIWCGGIIITVLLYTIFQDSIQDLISSDKLDRYLDRTSVLMPVMTPWQSIGGCGAGGSGGGTDGIKWVGEGVSGGLVQVEVLPK